MDTELTFPQIAASDQSCSHCPSGFSCSILSTCMRVASGQVLRQGNAQQQHALLRVMEELNQHGYSYPERNADCKLKDAAPEVHELIDQVIEIYRSLVAPKI